MQDSMKDADIEFGFAMAKGLGVKAITTSTTLTMAKRIAPLAESHKMMVGYHGHDQTNDSNQTATLESYDTLMGYGKYNGINLDVGHFTAANYDAVAFIKEHHAKITNLHLKDRKKNHGPNVADWGTGDTPLKDVLQLLKKEKYGFPANLELEYSGLNASNIVDETKKCYAYIKSCLV
jgi:sugar phosphate isomerase/epimerase